METIKFRIYDPVEKVMRESGATPMMLSSFFKSFATLDTVHKMKFQQFTGLLDKKGKEIYEGDIDIFGQQVVFIGGRYSLIDKEMNIEDLMGGSEDEIVGNIYEDKALLEAQK